MPMVFGLPPSITTASEPLGIFTALGRPFTLISSDVIARNVGVEIDVAVSGDHL